MRHLLVALFVLCPILAVAGPQKYEFVVDGMTCDECAQAVQHALNKIPNLEKSSVKVSFKGKSASLVLKDVDKDGENKIKKAVEDAGYTVTNLHVVQN